MPEATMTCAIRHAPSKSRGMIAIAPSSLAFSGTLAIACSRSFTSLSAMIILRSIAHEVVERAALPQSFYLAGHAVERDTDFNRIERGREHERMAHARRERAAHLRILD